MTAQAILDPLGLTFPQYLVLFERYSGALRAAGELGSSWPWTPAPRLLKRMQASDLVTRVRDAADERRVFVNLSLKAQTMRAEIWSITYKIKTACQLHDKAIDELRQALEGLEHPAPD
jgi:DNA-binding MarR family transcriptional regulator